MDVLGTLDLSVGQSKLMRSSCVRHEITDWLHGSHSLAIKWVSRSLPAAKAANILRASQPQDDFKRHQPVSSGNAASDSLAIDAAARAEAALLVLTHLVEGLLTGREKDGQQASSDYHNGAHRKHPSRCIHSTIGALAVSINNFAEEGGSLVDGGHVQSYWSGATRWNDRRAHSRRHNECRRAVKKAE
mmetsp:Transcript_6768/g.8839  ORF Transcript_6768/g.8839 Transcript_6768/m.8839 type:complete len:188 (-) Transcript_6768:42-605(-)